MITDVQVVPGPGGCGSFRGHVLISQKKGFADRMWPWHTVALSCHHLSVFVCDTLIWGKRCLGEGVEGVGAQKETKSETQQLSEHIMSRQTLREMCENTARFLHQHIRGWSKTHEMSTPDWSSHTHPFAELTYLDLSDFGDTFLPQKCILRETSFKNRKWDSSKVVHLPWKVILQCHRILCLPQKWDSNITKYCSCPQSPKSSFSDFFFLRLLLANCHEFLISPYLRGFSAQFLWSYASVCIFWCMSVCVCVYRLSLG